MALALVRPPHLASPPHPRRPNTNTNTSLRHPTVGVFCSSKPLPTDAGARSEYKPAPLDNLFLHLFRSKMVQESGWDSDKPGYDGLIEVANRLVIGRSNSETREAAVSGGRVAAVMVARVTALSCKWLMGPCTVNSVDLPNGSSWMSGVFVERCKYLEESKCVGICINTCKLPTQAFFKDCMGVPLLMEPKFSDYSCQFKFGILPPHDDDTVKEPCLEICPNAIKRKEDALRCPKALVPSVSPASYNKKKISTHKKGNGWVWAVSLP